MSQFPSGLDDDINLPRVDDNITELAAPAINALRDSMFAVEANIGINAQGTAASISTRLNNALNSDGTKILPSALVGAGLVTLPITDSEISPTAAIQETKLNLAYNTSSLFTLYSTLKTSVDTLNGFLSLIGIKLEPHIDGTSYNHNLSAINVDTSPAIVKTNPITTQSAGTNVINRNTTNADLLVKDISDDIVIHEKADGSSNVLPASGGTVPPLNYAHNASGVYVNSSTFSSIPQVNNDVQKVIEYFDSSSLLLLGSRTQNLYSNGISNTSRSSSIINDGYGIALVPPTPAIAYFLAVPPGPPSTSPVDDFAHGDDVILFTPTSAQLSSFNFDAQFAQVSPGDLLTINYGTGISYQFAIDSKKSIINGVNRIYAVRINGKNPISNTSAIARIDRATFNRNKFAVLAASRAPNNISAYESLIITNPRAAVALGNGFNPSQLDSTHFNLYLTLFPNGDLSNIYSLPAIDITGNQGATPGAYTLDTIIDSINTVCRAPGFNLRFNAFTYQGQIGITLADSYNNSSFSIISGLVDGYGNYTALSNSSLPNNVVDNFNNIDPLGFGINGSNVASPPATVSYANASIASTSPTLVFFPLKRNFFYADGVERERLKSDPVSINNIQDLNGDGYWQATITTVNVLPSRVEIVYTVNIDISDSGIIKGKTLVVQPVVENTNNLLNVNYGRFIISNIAVNNCGMTDAFANITVYDAIHGTGNSPYATLPVGSAVNLYFCDDTVSFDAENIFDQNTTGPYKRFFEVYVDGNGHTTTHERARFLTTSSDISTINLYRVSSKLNGYITSNDKEIRLNISSYSQTTGLFTGQLGRWNSSSSTFTNLGPLTTGKKGEIVRFYDETNIDYIEFIFNINLSLSSFTNKNLDIQLFRTLELDQQFMLVSSCQVDDTTKAVSYIKDERQFGNISEDQLSTSAINFINAGNKMLNGNGVIRGFNISATNSNIISISGGTALVNGSFVNINEQNITIPKLNELYSASIYNINYALCVNNKNELVLFPLTDYDPNLASPNAPSRLMTISNPMVGNTYSVDSSTFSTIVNTRKDLAVLYIVSSVVSGTGSSVLIAISVSDCRKFVNDGNYIAPITLTSDASQGNFNSIPALLNWLKFNSSFNTNVVLRGTFNITTPITLDFSNYQNVVKFVGDGATFNINSRRGLVLGSNISIDGIVFNYTYNPVGDGFYSTTNLVNSGGAAIYCSAQGYQNITVKNCIFNGTLTDRYSFINFDFTSYTSTLQNVIVDNNIFTSTSATDFRAAISIISNPTGTPTSTTFQRLFSAIISNNRCENDQLIIISANRKLLTANYVLNDTAIICQNVIVKNNNCGTIGIFTASGPALTLGGSSVLFDRHQSLTVDSNTVNYIASLDSFGGYIEYGLSAVDYVNLPTGFVRITNNTTSWIHVGIGNAGEHGIVISKNNFYAGNTAYLANYADLLNASQVGPNTAIVVRTKLTAVNSPTIISENIIKSGQTISGSTITTYNYIGYVAVYDSANIINNEMYGIGSSSSNNCIYFQGPQGIITGNKINRGSSTINSYVAAGSTTSYATVSENFFDSTTVDGTITATGANIPYTWIFQRNKNQTGFLYIPLFDKCLAIASSITNLGDGNYTYSQPSGNDYTVNSGVSSQFTGLGTTIGNGSGSTLNFYKPIDIGEYLDRGVQITEIRVGMYVSSGAITANANYYLQLQLMAYQNDMYSDIKNTYSTAPSFQSQKAFNLNTSGQVSLITSATQTLIFTPIGGDEQYTTVGNSYQLMIAFYAGIVFNAASYALQLSPIRVEFIW